MMMLNDFSDAAVLITGGTKGIGLATGLAFGRQGAHVYVTHKWGSADENAIRAHFAEAGAPEPVILEADAAEDEETLAVLERIRRDHERIEVFVSNVAFAQVVNELSDFRMRSFLTSVGYSAWPFVGHLQLMKQVFDRCPRYVVGMSSDGADSYYPGYDFVAAAKEVMDVFCRYLAVHFLGDDVRINVLRSRPVPTESLAATFGPDFEPFLRKYGGDDFLIGTEEVANAVLALCSGLMDAVSGQVLSLDRGVPFFDNLMRLYQHRDRLSTPSNDSTPRGDGP